ncbi:CDP-diacylglycerol--glycerol-3-phosphate 3-phosphatidyltransferase [Entomospira culicis]|uniref:CDP-diacylglycerol--glycerol-3-phosphate 3-phosphatidyltransferase n=1 Tax=Entomospira culicis TaxID=2719989 RepID=A0A968KU61_9SPIO|nr:CDP-diacylglycerol--glycerol-3-phosphate 3-phosphatidyltransferase [Entomospira culicis]NIZ18610.1 CDP-diacylglycerol--glycerol-3-phosphate 3-phosphatidyltransferase [Entomospira culicis]NIZ68825.1 CDP-diacylglycerol--glycerol-3-phosphate 3-phosphatidyltransferase [Entomospira culicis]WDI37419.1 CDP-diacylglycerol--glycerol-3-phosphate 3-phosphatidyltransferase [Entomospira culicis]WDI39047.1 CDP-diacylglycerol--glycerol-3-phosphate 3-phosphatidyltransferase [Entomospira culicis]
MTLPNKLTVSRLFITPIFYLLFLYTHQLEAYTPLRTTLAWVLFGAWLYCEISDVVDGFIARKYNLTSDMGKLLDPFADVLSRVTYFALFTQVGWVSFWPLLLIFWRELSITFIRAVTAKHGVAMGASSAGKTKAIFYFIMSLLGMLYFLALNYPQLQHLTHNQATLQLLNIVFMLTALASVLSFASYFAIFMRTPYMQEFIKE